VTPDRPRPAGAVAWCLYDWAMSAFNTVIGTFVFSVYFTRAVAADEIAGTALWSRALAASGVAVLVLSPVLGAIADRGGRRKPWLALLTLVTVGATAALWTVRPDPASVLAALVLVAVASAAFDLSGVFYNALLPAVAPPRMLGRISGWGWGLGYLGGLGSLVLCLVLLIRPEAPLFGLLDRDASEHLRATGPAVALWFAVFALPLFVFSPDRPGTGVTAARAVREGLAQLRATVARLAARDRNTALFLVSSAVYREGLNTLFAFGGIYAAGTFGMTFDQLIVFAIALNVSSAAGAALFAFADDRVGSKPTVMAALVGLMAAGVPILFVTDIGWFWALAVGLGLFVGPAQAASRTLMARLSAPGTETEMFGLYNLTGRAVGFVGPLALGLATEWSGSQRVGMATIVAMFAMGAAGLAFVREADRRAGP
jgi:UMF1 family MFS transporter